MIYSEIKKNVKIKQKTGIICKEERRKTKAAKKRQSANCIEKIGLSVTVCEERTKAMREMRLCVIGNYVSEAFPFFC